MKVLRVIAGNSKLWLFWWPFRLSAQYMPFKFSYCMVTVISRVAYILSRSKRNEMINALGSVMNINDKKRLSRVIRRSFDLRIKSDVDVLLYPRINEHNFRSLVSVEGLQYLDKALEKGKGVILLHSHFGNPQILMLGLGYLGYTLNQIGGNPTEDWEDLLKRRLTMLESKSLQLRLKCEETLPVNFIYVFKSMRPAFRCLERNEILAVAVDGGSDKSRVYLQFFNRTAFFSSGPLKLALKTKAEVLPLFVLRELNHKHRVVIEPPLKLNITGDMEKDIKENTQTFVSILEKYVIRYPWQYVQPLVGKINYRFVKPDSSPLQDLAKITKAA